MRSFYRAPKRGSSRFGYFGGIRLMMHGYNSTKRGDAIHLIELGEKTMRMKNSAYLSMW